MIAFKIVKCPGCSEETQTLRASCSKAESKKFAAPSRGRGTAKI